MGRVPKGPIAVPLAAAVLMLLSGVCAAAQMDLDEAFRSLRQNPRLTSGQFVVDERVISIISDKKAAKRYALAFLEDDDPQVRRLGMMVAAVLRDPELYPAVKSLFIPERPEDDGWPVVSKLVEEATLAMTSAVQVDRDAMLDQLILLQRFCYRVRARTDRKKEDKLFGDAAAAAMGVLKEAYHRTPIELRDPKSGSFVLMNGMIGGYSRKEIGDRADQLLVEGQITREVAEYVWEEFGDLRLLEKIRDRYLLYLGLADEWGNDDYSDFMGCINYFVRARDQRAIPWLILALRNEKVADDWDLRGRIAEALRVISRSRKLEDKAEDWEPLLERPYWKRLMDEAIVRMEGLVRQHKEAWERRLRQ